MPFIPFKRDCPNCGEKIELDVDTSEEPPDEVGTECDCGALPIWKVDWDYDVWIGEYLRDDSRR